MTLENSLLTLTPDTKWMEGISIEVIYNTESLGKYVVPSNVYFYSPEQVLYSNGTLTNTGNLDKLLTIGLVTPEEKSLLEAMGPKLTSLMFDMSKCLVTVFKYNI